MLKTAMLIIVVNANYKILNIMHIIIANLYLIVYYIYI